MKRRNPVYDAIRAHFQRIVHQNRHSGFHAGFYKHGFLPEINFRQFRQRPVHRWDYRADDYSGDFLRIELLQSKKIARQYAIFIHRLHARSRKPPVRDQFFTAEDSEDGVGIAYINRQQHEFILVYLISVTSPAKTVTTVPSRRRTCSRPSGRSPAVTPK